MGSFLSTYGWGWAVAAAVAVLHLRSLPLAYTLRSLYHMARALPASARLTDLRQNVSLTMWNTLDDCDHNLHMNNASYNKNADYCRARYLISLFGPMLKRIKIANGGVAMRFQREIKPFASYVIRTELAGFDRKWFYLRHAFESPDGKVRYCSGMAKMVAKERSGKTIPPAKLWEELGVDGADDAEFFRDEGSAPDADKRAVASGTDFRDPAAASGGARRRQASSGQGPDSDGRGGSAGAAADDGSAAVHGGVCRAWPQLESFL